MNIWQIIYFNCGERYELMVHHRSYTNKKYTQGFNARQLLYELSSLYLGYQLQQGNFFLVKKSNRFLSISTLTAWVAMIIKYYKVRVMVLELI